MNLAKAEYFIIDGKYERMEFPYVNQVTCLELGLNENILCKKKIIDILKTNAYDISVLPAYYIRGIEVELLEDGKYFKIK